MLNNLFHLPNVTTNANNIFDLLYFDEIRTLQHLDMLEFRSFRIVKFVVSWNWEVLRNSQVTDYRLFCTYILLTVVFHGRNSQRSRFTLFPRDIALTLYRVKLAEIYDNDNPFDALNRPEKRVGGDLLFSTWRSQHRITGWQAVLLALG